MTPLYLKPGKEYDALKKYSILELIIYFYHLKDLKYNFIVLYKIKAGSLSSGPIRYLCRWLNKFEMSGKVKLEADLENDF